MEKSISLNNGEYENLLSINNNDCPEFKKALKSLGRYSRNSLFKKLHCKSLYRLIFSYLTIANIRIIAILNKRMYKIVNENNKALYKIIKENTYALNKRIDLDNQNIDYTVRHIKTNMFPIIICEFAEDLNIFFTSPCGYNSENIKVWCIKKKTCIGEVLMYNPNSQEEKIYIETFKYMRKSNQLAVSQSNCFLLFYNVEYKNFKDKLFENPQFVIQLNTVNLKGGRLYYNSNIDELISIEEEDCLLNIVKTFNNKGKIQKTSILINELIRDCLITDCYDLMIFGTNCGSTYFMKYSSMMNNFSHLITTNKLKGPQTEIEKLLFIKERNMLVVVHQYIGMFIWNVEFYLNKLGLIENVHLNKNCFLITQVTLTFHIDRVNSLVLFDNNTIASAGSDCKIMIWSLPDKPITEVSESNERSLLIKEINHVNTIYNLFYKDKDLLITSYDKDILLVTFNDSYEIVKQTNFNGHTTNVRCWQIDHLKDLLYTVSLEKKLKIWDLKEFKLKNTVDCVKEIFDGFILLNDSFNTIVKIDLTKDIKFLHITKENKLINHFSYKDTIGIRQIVNFFDGTNFAVGYNSSQTAIFRYNTEKINLYRCEKIIVIELPEVSFNKFFPTTNLNEDENLNVNVNVNAVTKQSKITKLSICEHYENKYMAIGGNLGLLSIISKSGDILVSNQINEIKLDIIDIVQLSKNEFFSLSVLFSNGEMYIFRVNENSSIKFQSTNKINCICRLSEYYFALGFNNYNHIEIYDNVGNSCESIMTTFNNTKSIIYLYDNKSIVVISGSNNNEFAMDVITMK